MPPRRAAARKAATPAAPKPKPAAAKKARARGGRTSTSTDEVPVDVKPTVPADITARLEGRGGGEEAGGVAGGTMMGRDNVIDIADEVYHAHDRAHYDEDEIEEEWENSFDVPRVDFYFTDHTSELQRTLVYRTALLFSSAPPSAPLHIDEYVEDWVDRCNVSITGPGGPLTMEEEMEMRMEDHMAWEEEEEEAKAAAAAGGGGEGEQEASEGEGEQGEGEGEEGEEEETEEERKPYMLVFPTAKRVIDFIAYLGTDGLYNVWLKPEHEGEARPREDEYEPKTRLWWRMNQSEWIPAYC